MRLLPLEHFLNKARSEGTFQSEGRFTLSVHESLEKLAASQFDPPALWIVKVVQCAVALGSKSLEIKVTRRSLQVAFDGDIGLTANKLLEVLTNPGERTSLAVFHLVTGLRAVYGQKTGLLWRCFSTNGTTLVSVEEAGVHQWTFPGSAAPRFELAVHRPFDISRPSLKGWLGWNFQELELVKDRCWPAPIEINLDGLPLRTATRPSVPTLARWEVPLGDSGRPEIWARSEEDAIAKVERSPGGVAWNPLPKKGQLYLDRRVHLTAREASIHSLLTLEIQPQGVSRIFYVVHGAIVAGPPLKFRLPYDLTVCYYVRADTASVDLSGFSSKTRYPELLENVHLELREMVNLFLALLSDKQTMEEAETNPRAVGLKVAAVTLATFMKGSPLLVGMVGLPLTLVLGGGAMTAAKMSKQKRAMDRLDLANALRRLKQQVRYVVKP